MNTQQKKEMLEWLNNPERTAKEGKLLYAEHGVNININRRLKHLSDDRALGILEIQFKKMLGLSVLPEQKDKKRTPAAKEKPKQSKNKVPNTVIPPRRELKDPYPKDARPEALIPVYEEKERYYIEAKNLNAILIAKGDELENLKPESKKYKKLAEERRQLAKKIIDLYDGVNRCWKKIDYFAQHKQLPEKEILEKKPEINAPIDDPLELAKRYRTLSSYISKARKNPERNQEKLKELYAESNAIAEKLNAIYGEEKFKLRGNETPADKGNEKTESEK